MGSGESSKCLRLKIMCLQALYFTGPSLAKLSLKKTDQFSKYVFEYSWTTKAMDESTNKLVNEVKLTYDTPGSNVARRSSLEVKFDAVLSYVAASVEIPINKVIREPELFYQYSVATRRDQSTLSSLCPLPSNQQIKKKFQELPE